MVFIDPGFVLLIGFLILIETAPRSSVALPGDAEGASESMSKLMVFNIHFSREGRFRVENGTHQFCDLDEVELLESCVQQVAQNHVGAVFVLVPAGLATVQQLVSLFDMCTLNEWTCTVNN